MKKALFFFLLFNFENLYGAATRAATGLKRTLLYAGKGVFDHKLLPPLESLLSKYGAVVKRVTEAELREGATYAHADNIVIPGCQAGEVETAIGPVGIELLKAKISGGLNCLTICGGTYWFSHLRRWCEGTSHEKVTAGLDFYTYEAIGPFGWDKEGHPIESTRMEVTIHPSGKDGKPFAAQMIAGCALVGKKDPQFPTLATLPTGERVAVRGSYGKGTVTSVSFHPEISPPSPGLDAFLEVILGKPPVAAETASLPACPSEEDDDSDSICGEFQAWEAMGSTL